MADTTTAPAGAGTPADPQDDERRRDEEADRRLDELLQELRVVLPGTTVLFGFLLAVSVSNRFEDFSRLNRTTYMVAFLAAAMAVVFLLAEAGYHRLVGHPYDKHSMIRTTSRQAVAALALLGVALVASVALVVELVYGTAPAVAAGAVVGLLVLSVWFGLPLRRRISGDAQP
jgi:Family of unknown function (DUF6328)